MQNRLYIESLSTAEAQELHDNLRKCVHCGFCNATCPTYQLTGDELDGPRGRIYLLKQMLDGSAISHKTQLHLDRCLNCRSCETTCPSGVRYSRLYEIGNILVDIKIGRNMIRRIIRKIMLLVFPYKHRFGFAFHLAAKIKPLLTENLRDKLVVRQNPVFKLTNNEHNRKVLLLPGCVQSVLAPSIDFAARKVLDQVGISTIVVQHSHCCGSLSCHLSDRNAAKIFAKNNIDVCWPYIEQGVEAITQCSSGCSLFLKEYAELLKDDAEYSEKARIFSLLIKDISEMLGNGTLMPDLLSGKRIAFQSPCTLQHGLRISQQVEQILTGTGAELLPVRDSHLCCGSAGVYSLMLPEFANQLRDMKLSELNRNSPDHIVTANIGCLNHLQNKSKVKVSHWLEVLAESLD